MNDINPRMAAGVAWMSLMRISIRMLGLLSTVILARVLVPDDFGLVAMATAIMAALELFRQFSFDVALVQRQDAPRSFYDTAWTFNILFGIALALVLLAVAVPAATFYDEPRLTGILSALALGAAVSGFENVGVVAYVKDLTFHKEFLLRVAQKAGTIAITLPLAFALRSYWALVIGMVAGNVINVVITYVAHPFRPRLALTESRRLLGFSKWLLANNFLWFLRDRTPDFLLGKVAGTEALGLFTVGAEISNLPTTELVAPINRAVFPAYSKIANDIEALRKGFLDVIGLVVLLALPAGFGVAATAELLVATILGGNWTAAVPIVSVMGMFGALNAMQTNCGALHYAMGNPKTLTLVGAIVILILFPSLVWGGLRFGAIGIAWAYLVNAVLVIVPLNYGLALRAIRLPAAALLRLLWRPIIATTVMYFSVRAWVVRSGPASASGLDEILPLLGAVAIGCITYSVVVWLLWRAVGQPAGPERAVLGKISEILGDRLPRRAV